MKKNNIYKEVSDNLGFEEDVVRDVFVTTWEFIKDKIAELPLKDTDYSEDEFNKLRTSFNLPGLGKLGCSYRSYKNQLILNKRKRDAKDKKRKANGKPSNNDNG